MVWTGQWTPSWRVCPLTCAPDSSALRELIAAVGLPNVREPHVKHLRGAVWEMRLAGKAGIARALYVTATGHRVIVVRAFVKKTPKTPVGEIALALQRAKELET